MLATRVPSDALEVMERVGRPKNRGKCRKISDKNNKSILG